MKKIPTLFERLYQNNRVVGIVSNITPGCEKAFLEGVATVKFDGSCCAIIDGVFYKRYDAKNGKTPPDGAIPCCDPDPITGHHPHWVPVDKNNPGDKWFIEAIDNTFISYKGINRTFEAVGPHFQGNPHNLEKDQLIPHGEMRVEIKRTFDDIFNYLRVNLVEGLVFWYENEPVCKIKRTDFGFQWPVTGD